jgi:phosphate butyryltransferase
MNVSIGKHLREYIKKENIDKEIVAEALGWDVAIFEKILKDELSPRASELLNIANVLGTDIATLLYGQGHEKKRAVKTTRSERIRVDRKNYMHYESLAPSYAGRHLEPFVVDIYPDHEREPEVSAHGGEEFHYILSGHVRITVDGVPYDLKVGDSFYFDSSQPHTVVSVTEHSRMMSVIYNSDSMVQMAKGKGMRAIIEAARLIKQKSVAVVCPDSAALAALNKGIEERIVKEIILVGDRELINRQCLGALTHSSRYKYIHVDSKAEDYEAQAAKKAVEAVRAGKAQMIMKGKINTSTFSRAILSKSDGLGTGRRLSMVSIFEIPNLDRLVFLTDAGINPELFTGDSPETGVDIVKNGIDVARSMGIERPKVALLEANEVPSDKIPTSKYESMLSEKEWDSADVFGPLSYDLALYEDSVEKKGLSENPVAGRADVLVVPFISGGNFLYKTWVMTLGADVANVVIGAGAPVVLTSRSDSDVTKFLTLCASAIYSEYLENGG